MNLHRTWAGLIALSLLTAAVTAGDLPRAALVVAVLALAGMKARLILRHYLELRQAPAWARGFDLVLMGLLMAFAGLALAA